MDNTIYRQHIYFDEPVPFGESKNIKIYPIRMRDYPKFLGLSTVLIQDIYSTPDPEIIQMKYLEYIFKYSNEKNQFIAMLIYVLSMVLKVSLDDILFSTARNILSVRYKTDEGDINEVIDASDFEEIRKIIAVQNNLEIPNFKIDKRIRKSQEEAARIRSNSKKEATLEDYMISLVAATGISFDKIYGMTARKFFKLLERIDLKINYEILFSAQMSGLVTFKNKNVVKHWLSHIEKNEFDGLMPLSELERKTGQSKS